MLKHHVAMLKDKVVVVTGGAGTLGQEFARTILNNGGVAIVVDICRHRIERLQEKLSVQSPSARAEGFHADITNKESLSLLVNDVDNRHGRIDALVNNAYPRNANYGRRFEDVEYDDFCHNVGMHLGGYFLASQVFANYFQKQGFGNIVSVSSVYGLIAPRFEIYAGTEMTMPVEYAAIKSAVLHLTRYMAAYFRGKNIRFNAICPGGIAGAQPPEFVEKYNACCLNKGILDASDICGALLFLLSDLSRYVNGQTIVVDDGFTL